MMATVRHLSVQQKLLSALCALSISTVLIGVVAWVAVDRSDKQLRALHASTVANVENALDITSLASRLSSTAPFLLTLQSPFLVRKEAGELKATAGQILDRSTSLSKLQPAIAKQFGERLASLNQAISDLVLTSDRLSNLRDQKIRVDRELRLMSKEVSSTGDANDSAHLSQLRQFMDLLSPASRTDNLFDLGELERRYHNLRREVLNGSSGSQLLDMIHGRAASVERIFELRRQEFGLLASARGALHRIRDQVENINKLSAAVVDEADVKLQAARNLTGASIDYAKITIFVFGMASAAIAALAALFVVRYVVPNLKAISDSMVRLSLGDRASRLARMPQSDDEIGKLSRAFRMFRATVLRLDRRNRQLLQKNTLFEEVVTGIHDGVAITNAQGALAAGSTSLSRVLRIEPGLIRRNGSLLGILESSPFAVPDLRPAVARDSFELTSADGETIECRVSRLPDGGAVWLFSDVTERRQMQERLSQIQRIESLGKISGEIAHDFGNVLSTISGNLHLLETARADMAIVLRQRMANAAELGATLVQRLLAFARRQHLEPEVTDLNLLVSGMTDLVEIALNGEVELVTRLTDSPLLARVDPGQMESALLNICLNSRQAMEDKGRIEITVRPRGVESGEIEIKDNGSGMSQDILRRCLDPFFTARRDGQGTGLGLSMVYGFIRQSGGDMKIQSRPGRGTTVSLIVPLTGADASVLT